MKVSLHRISKLGPSENPDSSLRARINLVKYVSQTSASGKTNVRIL